MEFRLNSEKVTIQPIINALESCLYISIPLEYNRYGIMPLQFKGELSLDH